MKVRPLPAPQIIDKMKYDIIFRGASFKTRCIEVYLPEYKHSQWILRHPVGSKYLFGFIDDAFWRSHSDLKKEFNVICHNIALKHLSFVMGWDMREEENNYEWWQFWVKQWEEAGYIKLTDEERKIVLKSFYNKYTRNKGSRKYQFVEQ